ncbi:trem-like transcript 4 protein isoform X2 [Erinaceus europaeus]|uniref:Trem-like transcript 4 protein isoform X2 n=1 Tax=Erinaceus europaeus TaxID=9365 RepID=A0A1S3WKH6_ERIEU|nr:trem-like transcript 4 protein isoform X2 [Erinaceus europaeus]
MAWLAPSPSRMLNRKKGIGFWGWPWLLALLLWVSEFQAVDKEEVAQCLNEGENLTVVCTYNLNLYASSLKAWQRVTSQGPPQTLVHTTTRDPDVNRAQMGRYLLEDFPTEASFRVIMTELQKQDLGLYQCVINLSPNDPVVLLPRTRLMLCTVGTIHLSGLFHHQNQLWSDMALRAPHLFLLPALLVLLTSGFWGDAANPEMLHEVVGRTLALQCQYPPEKGPYKSKSWCRQIAPNSCQRVVTTLQPREAVSNSNTMIWDAPDAGIFIVLMIQLKEEDLGTYWCGRYNSSKNKIDIFRNITVVMPPATTSSPVKISTTFSPSTALTFYSEGTSDPPCCNISEHRSQIYPSSGVPASPIPLMAMLCGLFVTKVLGLSVPVLQMPATGICS